VLLVYPGPPADLDQHAKEFLVKQADLPANIIMAIDPDYKMTTHHLAIKCATSLFPTISGASRVGKCPTPSSTMRSKGPTNFSDILSVIAGGETPSRALWKKIVGVLSRLVVLMLVSISTLRGSTAASPQREQ
jgi:hypothetical protein